MNIKELDTFGKRLSYLLDLKEIRKKDIADSLNIAAPTLSGYLNDSRRPDLQMLAKIANYLNVNADFLLMRSEDYRTYISRKIDGDLIEIEFDDEKLHLSEKEIENLFAKLKSVGFNVKNLL